MRKNRYRQYGVCRITNDWKLMIGANNNGIVHVRYAVKLRSDERAFAQAAGLIDIDIEATEIRSFLASAASLMQSAGYTLETRCRTYIEWITDDGRWCLIRQKKNIGPWQVRSVDSKKPIQPPDGIEFLTRDQAAAYANSL